MSLNELCHQVASISDRYYKENPDTKSVDKNVCRALLGLYESATKLSTAYLCDKDRAEIEKRIANVFYGTCEVMHTLHMDDPESIFQKRIIELEHELFSPSTSLREDPS